MSDSYTLHIEVPVRIYTYIYMRIIVNEKIRENLK